MSYTGSTSDISSTSSLRQQERLKSRMMRFTLDELAVLSGADCSTSLAHNLTENPCDNARRLLRIIRQKEGINRKIDGMPQNKDDSAEEILEIIRKKDQKNGSTVRDTNLQYTNAETQTEKEMDEVIREVEEIEKHADIVTDVKRKSRKAYHHDNDSELTDNPLLELDSEIFQNKFTQTIALCDKTIYQSIIDFPMPSRKVKGRTDHRWPKGHRLYTKFSFDCG